MNPSLEWTIAQLTSLSEMGYTGKIELNFNLGGITNVNMNQSLKPLQEIRLIPMGKAALSLN